MALSPSGEALRPYSNRGCLDPGADPRGEQILHALRTPRGSIRQRVPDLERASELEGGSLDRLNGLNY